MGIFLGESGKFRWGFLRWFWEVALGGLLGGIFGFGGEIWMIWRLSMNMNDVGVVELGRLEKENYCMNFVRVELSN